MSQLLDLPVPTKVKLGALWAATMSCYIYCDYFQLYTPGKLAEMQAGKMGPLGPATQGVLLGTGILMAVPSVMIFLSVALPARANRIVNIVVGAFYTLLLGMIAASAGWLFYRFFAVLEAILTAVVVGIAWRWPRPDRHADLLLDERRGVTSH